jgi:hypothetical protein
MTQHPRMHLGFRLVAEAPDLAVDVRLRSFGDRWMAVADIAGEVEIGLGRTAREALVGALARLDQYAASALLSDLALLAPSVEIASQEQRLGA